MEREGLDHRLGLIRLPPPGARSCADRAHLNLRSPPSVGFCPFTIGSPSEGARPPATISCRGDTSRRTPDVASGCACLRKGLNRFAVGRRLHTAFPSASAFLSKWPR